MRPRHGDLPLGTVFWLVSGLSHLGHNQMKNCPKWDNPNCATVPNGTIRGKIHYGSIEHSRVPCSRMRKVPLGARPTLAGWYAHHDAGHRPPLAREEALRSASELADQAMQMAETKGMGATWQGRRNSSTRLRHVPNGRRAGASEGSSHRSSV